MGYGPRFTMGTITCQEGYGGIVYFVFNDNYYKHTEISHFDRYCELELFMTDKDYE